MADQLLKYTLVFDKKTGAISDVRQEIAGIETQTNQLPKAAGKSEEAFNKLGSSIKKIGISLILLSALKAAADTNDAFLELKATITETASALLGEFEPVLGLISKGLQGVLILIVGFVKATKSLIMGDWKDSMKIMADSLNDSANRINGITTAMTEKEKDKIKELTRARKEAADKERERMKKQEDETKQFVGGSIQAFADGVTARKKQTNDVLEIAKAGGEQVIKFMLEQAQKEVIIAGTAAAIKSFNNAGGFPFGIPAAAASLAFTGALAAGLGLVSGAIGGGAGGGSSSPAGGGTGAGTGAGAPEGFGGAAPVSQTPQVINVNIMGDNFSSDYMIRRLAKDLSAAVENKSVRLVASQTGQ
jgi:hypothetical protein